MQLQEIYSFTPAKFAYHLSQHPLLLAVHPSSYYLAFATRANEVALYNRKTGRVSVLFSSKHGIANLTFTEKYLVVVQRTTPQLLIFSMKSQKLKKKLTGHSSQSLSLHYNRNRQLLCSTSHNLCIVWQQSTLTITKMLRCSTSSYCDCHFTMNGQYLFTSFADGNIFGWDLENWESNQKCAITLQSHRLCSANNQVVVAYSRARVWVGEVGDGGLFQEVQGFWDGYIQFVDCVDCYILIKTTMGFYLAQLTKSHKPTLTNPHKLTDQIQTFLCSKYNSQITIVSKDLSKIRTMQILSEALTNKIPLTNGLLNPNSQCIGGYSGQDGCVAQQLPNGVSTYNYCDQNYKVERMNQGIYHQKRGEIVFSDQKVKLFIRKNYFFPDKYRAVAYKNMLGFPISKKGFLQLERKGRHSCIKLLDNKYPLNNANLSEAMKDVLSLLAHYSPIFAESDLIPPLIFPFVCIFGEDRFFCFEVLYRLFNNWLSCLFNNFPLANSQLLQNFQQLFQKQDQLLLNHLNQNGISFTKLVWSLLSTLFSINLNRDGFLAVVDTLIAHPEDPSFVIFMVMAYIEYNRTRIFSLKSEQDLDMFLEQQHTVNISTFIKKAYQLRQKLQKHIRYAFRAVNHNDKHYLQYNCFPKHAVKMYEGKRRLEEEQYEKIMNEQRYHQEIEKEMDKMVIKIKRESDKAVIESQAIALQSENQLKNPINIPKTKIAERKKKILVLMERLEQMLVNRSDTKQKMREYIPLLNNLSSQQNQQQLDQMQHKLMSLMTKLQPHQFNLPLNSQPMTFGKGKADQFKVLKAAKHAQIANKLWETDKMGHQLQENMWENNFQRAVKF